MISSQLLLILIFFWWLTDVSTLYCNLRFQLFNIFLHCFIWLHLIFQFGRFHINRRIDHEPPHSCNQLRFCNFKQKKIVSMITIFLIRFFLLHRFTALLTWFESEAFFSRFFLRSKLTVFFSFGAVLFSTR